MDPAAPQAPATAGATAARSPQAGATGMFASLRFPNYRLLFMGTMGMSAGQWVQQVTLGWLVYDLTGSPVLLGALNGLRAVPFLLFGPLAGVVADRMDRKRMVGVVAVVISLTAWIMGAVVLTGHREVWHLFLFTAITGTAWAFNQPARQSLVSDTVPREHLMNAIALTSAGFNTLKVLAPVMGGFLIAAFGPGGNFLVQGAAYLLVLGSVTAMRIPSTVKQTQTASVWANMKEGLKYVAADRMLLAVMALQLVPTLLAMPYQLLMPVFQKDVLHEGPESLGLLLGAPAIGALVATLVLASMSNRMHHKGRVLLVTLVAWGLSLALFSRMESLPTALLSLVAVGACQVLYNATNNTILQLIVPAELRGRVMGIYFLDQGFQPAGALASGLVTAAIGPQDTVLCMGFSVVLMGVIAAWKVPQLRDWHQ